VSALYAHPGQTAYSFWAVYTTAMPGPGSSITKEQFHLNRSIGCWVMATKRLSYGKFKKKSHLVTWLSSSKCAVVYQICSKSDDFYRAMRGLCCRKDVRLSVSQYHSPIFSRMSPQTFSLSGRHILVLNGMTIFRGNRLTRASNAGLWTNRDFLTIISLYLYYTGWANLNGASLHFCL